jgi:hypothetical protein
MREATMHGFLLHFMFRWNVDRRRSCGKERDWHVYDFLLLDGAYQACVRVVGYGDAALLWEGGFVLPRRLHTKEAFGLRHHHATLSERMELASDRLPMSDDLLHRIIDSFADATTALPSAHISLLVQTTPAGTDACTDFKTADTDQPLHSGHEHSNADRAVSLLPPVRRMTPTEQRLLSDIIRHDTLMRDVIHNQQWDVAASRWNSFIQRCSSDPLASRTLRGALHAAHGDVLQSAVAAINKRRETDVEHDIVRMREGIPHLHLEYVSASQQPFTSYEDTVLLQLVEKCTSNPSAGKKKIDWSSIATSWLYRHHSEIEAGLARHLLLRDKNTLKSHQQTLLKRLAAPAAESESGGAPTDPTPPLLTADVPMDDDEPNLPVSQTSALSTIGSWIRLSFLDATPQSSSQSSSSSSSSPSSSSSTVPSVRAPHPSPAFAHAAARSPIKGKWPPKATQRFNALHEETLSRHAKWTYDEFCKLWPADVFGHVSRDRWIAKNRTEKNKRTESGTTTARMTLQ